MATEPMSFSGTTKTNILNYGLGSILLTSPTQYYEGGVDCLEFAADAERGNRGGVRITL